MSVEPYVKTYSLDVPADAECHVAYVDGRTAGELRCGKHWNGYLCVHDLVVGAGFRRQGIGQALVQRAKWRANELGLAGVTADRVCKPGACGPFRDSRSATAHL